MLTPDRTFDLPRDFFQPPPAGQTLSAWRVIIEFSFKQSGVGCEMGKHALDSYTKTKSVMMAI